MFEERSNNGHSTNEAARLQRCTLPPCSPVHSFPVGCATNAQQFRKFCGLMGVLRAPNFLSSVLGSQTRRTLGAHTWSVSSPACERRGAGARVSKLERASPTSETADPGGSRYLWDSEYNEKWSTQAALKPSRRSEVEFTSWHFIPSYLWYLVFGGASFVFNCASAPPGNAILIVRLIPFARHS